MTYAEVEAFLTIIKSGTLSKAAEELFISQPALSRRIKSLEAELGCTLLWRKPGIRNCIPTEAGKNFIELANRWVVLNKDIRDLHKKTARLPLRLSSLDSIGTYLFPPIFKDYLQENDDVQLFVEELNLYPAYEKLEQGALDIAFTIDCHFSEKISSLPAFQETMELIASPEYDLPESIHLKDLRRADEIYIPWSPEYEKWRQRWSQFQTPPYITIQKMTYLEYFIQNEKSWAIVPASVAVSLKNRFSLHTSQLEEQPPKRIINYLTISNNKSELIESFLQCLQEHLKNSDIPGIELLL